MSIKELLQDFDYYYEMYRYSSFYLLNKPFIHNEAIAHSIHINYQNGRLYMLKERYGNYNEGVEIEPRNIEHFIQKVTGQACGICYNEESSFYACCPICFNSICLFCLRVRKCPFCRSEDCKVNGDLYMIGGLRMFVHNGKCYGDDMATFKCEFECKCCVVECGCEPDDCEGEDCEFRYDYSIRCDCKCAEHPKSVSYEIDLLYTNEAYKKYRYVMLELMEL
jgi:hypothetical protein